MPMPILHISIDMDTVAPKSGFFTRVRFYSPEWWTVEHFATFLSGYKNIERDLWRFNSVSGVLGHLHSWSRQLVSDEPIFMTQESSEILLPGMALPVMEYRLPVTIAELQRA
jgi:hypothetical protein